HRGAWNGSELGLEGGKVVAGERHALVARELGQRDAEIGGAAGIVRVVVVAAFHLQHVGEPALERLVFAGRRHSGSLDGGGRARGGARAGGRGRGRRASGRVGRGRGRGGRPRRRSARCGGWGGGGAPGRRRDRPGGGGAGGVGRWVVWGVSGGAHV